jgi:aminopeptidase
MLNDNADAALRVNASAVHTDFMIGGPGVRVSGRTHDGARVVVLDEHGDWQLP